MPNKYLQAVLEFRKYFYIIGNMEIKDIVAALGALAQETRLAIFRLLVETGPQGLPVGRIAERLGLANATLSFHLKELTNTGLAVATPNGRSIIYSANFLTMNSVLDYLTENCCAGANCDSTAACIPVKVIAPRRRKTPERKKS
jgi:DNA-binding transcriptional ArsR family regulator